MAAGLGLLRLAPRDFWAMTPKELSAALRGVFGLRALPQAMGRAELESLMQLYPDEAETRTGNG